MINLIMKKDSKIVSKEDCAFQIKELKRKKMVVMALIREYALKYEIEDWTTKSPVMLLCSSLNYVDKVEEMLDMLLKIYKDKPQIRVKESEYTLYVILCDALIKTAKTLKEHHNISIIPELYLN